MENPKIIKMRRMKIESSYKKKKKYSFRRIKRKIKLNYKYIIFFLFFTFLIFFIFFVFSLFLRVKKTENIEKIEKIEKPLNFVNSKPTQSSKENNQKKNRTELLMQMVNYDQKYINVTKCFTDDPEKELCFYQFLVPKKVVGKELKLIGPSRDGGYVLLNDMEDVSIAYSIGVDHEISFDDALAKKNIDVYMYDHTINYLIGMNPRFHWKKIGISGISNKSNNTKTLEEMLEENGHLNKKNMILKIDVEHAEWEALLDTSEEILKKFKLITIEFHFKNETEKYFKVLKKLYKTHQVIYLICNNYNNDIEILRNNIICGCIEISYVIREGNEFYSDNTTYPIPGIKLKNYVKPLHSFNLNIIKLFDNENN